LGTIGKADVTALKIARIVLQMSDIRIAPWYEHYCSVGYGVDVMAIMAHTNFGEGQIWRKPVFLLAPPNP
jgi:hypothetical protein